MEKIKELFRKHPYLIGGGALVVFVIFYYLFSRSSGGTTYTSGNASGSSSGTDQYAAQEAIAQLQAQTALQGKQIDASVATQQISAAQDVQKYQTDAHLKALLSNNDTQVQLASVQAGVNEAQIGALENIVTAQYTTQQKATDAVFSYLTAKSADATTLQTKAIDTQKELDLASLSHVKDVNGSQNRTAIILGATGNIPGSVSAAQGQTLSSISGDNLLSSVSKSVAGAFSALF